MSISERVDELVRTGRFSVDQAIAQAVTEAASHQDPFLVMRAEAKAKGLLK